MPTLTEHPETADHGHVNLTALADLLNHAANTHTGNSLTDKFIADLYAHLADEMRAAGQQLANVGA